MSSVNLSQNKNAYFPIAILRNGAKTLSLIDSPECLPQATEFRIILTNVTSDAFTVADKTTKILLCGYNLVSV